MRDRSTDRPKSGGRPGVRPGGKPGGSHSGGKPGGTHPGAKPGTTHPSAKPGTTHPSAKPGTTHPGTKPGTTHPGTKPGTTHEQRDRRERFERARRESLRPEDLTVLYGLHTVKAALENPARKIRKFLATENAARRLTEEGVTASPELVRPGAIDERLAPDAVHQGLYLEADPLPSPEIAEIAGGPVLVLDQITDPHNVGAILRTAAGFDVAAVVTTARHSPEATGALAKAASGALEYVPIVTVQNLARAMAELKERGYLLVGLELDERRRPQRRAAARPARARPGRGRQRAAATDARKLRPCRPARAAGPDQVAQRVECRRARALCHDQAARLKAERSSVCSAP